MHYLYLCTRGNQYNIFYMRKVLLSLLLVASVSAAKASNTLTVLAIDGSEAAKYDVDATQRVDLTNPDSVIIVMADGTTAAFSADQYPRLRFTKVATAIQAPTAATRSGQLRAWADGNTLFVAGTTAGERIGLFTIGGARIANGATVDGITRVNVGQLPKGVYVVKAGKQAVKIIKR